MEDVAVAAAPSVLGTGVLPGELGEFDTGVEQSAGVGGHALERADAQLVVAGGGVEEAAHQPVAARVVGVATDDGGGGARAQGEGGEVGDDVVEALAVIVELGDRVVVDLAGALAVDDHGVVDLAGVDHHARQVHAVDESEAGVGDVEVEAGGGQPECVVDGDGTRRLQPGTAHAGVDQEADPGPVDARGDDRRLTGHRRGVGERDAFGPHAPFADAGQRFEQARPAVGALVERTKAFVDLVGGDDDRRFDRFDRHEGDVLETEVGVLVHDAPVILEGGSPHPRAPTTPNGAAGGRRPLGGGRTCARAVASDRSSTRRDHRLSRDRSAGGVASPPPTGPASPTLRAEPPRPRTSEPRYVAPMARQPPPSEESS